MTNIRSLSSVHDIILSTLVTQFAVCLNDLRIDLMFNFLVQFVLCVALAKRVISGRSVIEFKKRNLGNK